MAGMGAVPGTMPRVYIFLSRWKDGYKYMWEPIHRRMAKQRLADESPPTKAGAVCACQPATRPRDLSQFSKSAFETLPVALSTISQSSKFAAHGEKSFEFANSAFVSLPSLSVSTSSNFLLKSASFMTR